MSSQVGTVEMSESEPSDEPTKSPLLSKPDLYREVRDKKEGYLITDPLTTVGKGA